MTAFKIVIPARYGATRLPGKPIRLLAGKPMIVHVCERALACEKEVVVATDDPRIEEVIVASGLPVRVVMTRIDHTSGTERIAEVADLLGWPDSTSIINLQGDEPLMRPDWIEQLGQALQEDTTVEVVTLAAPIRERAEVFVPDMVKVVTNQAGRALYFSRAPIPWHRTSFATDESIHPLPTHFTWRRHIGIYGYSAGFLRRYIRWPVSQLETVETLEQLRILWHGENIRVLETDTAPEIGVDTEEDLQRVEGLLKKLQ